MVTAVLLFLTRSLTKGEIGSQHIVIQVGIQSKCTFKRLPCWKGDTLEEKLWSVGGWYPNGPVSPPYWPLSSTFATSLWKLASWGQGFVWQNVKWLLSFFERRSTYCILIPPLELYIDLPLASIWENWGKGLFLILLDCQLLRGGILVKWNLRRVRFFLALRTKIWSLTFSSVNLWDLFNGSEITWV